LIAVAALAALLALSGCSTPGSGIQAGEHVTVYVSIPLRGAEAIDGRDVVRGARLALGDAHGRVGELEVRAVYFDDTAARGRAARWDQATAAANARRATEDSTAIAYVGDFDSGASRSSLPITNEARILQVSPASSAVDLVAPFAGSHDVPEDVQPTGDRNFGRVIPSDVALSAARRAWAKRLGAPRVGALHATSEAAALRSRGLRYAASAAQDPSQLPAAGRRIMRAFRERYGRSPGRFAAYGYEAMAVVLDAIRRAGDQGDERDAVTSAFFDTVDRRSILGTYSIDDVGDTSLDRLAGYRIAAGGRPVFDTGLTAP
jgi:ABC-type branched-subunit amino acid transport system substrate-binding protein